ncbi:dihydrofolate reductase [Bacillus phage Moonbeam]|uniref:dihydrofolate reductase n=1 Tax=Bacillus phage Moonbeam TaxID=1540091 RepID=A0A0A0RMX1_9CAUD|nr:dihydrofolate reductase [Bacillus phage Moonbeam]AIW03415.1 dihydrofolate reductase [Bacillus phage Moonbeam]
MHVSLIAAMGKNGELGKDNKLLWHIKEDFNWFKKHTKNRVVVMGRKTYESLPNGPLPKRLNVVVTSDPDYSPHPDVVVMNSLYKVFVEFRHEIEIMVIGGATLYEQCLPLANRIYLTEIDKAFDADTYFPEFDTELWDRFFHQEGVEDVGFKYSFNVYKKKLI